MPIATARRIWLYQLPPAGWGHWLLAGAIDTQIDLARSRSRQAIIAFYLAGEGVEAGFTLREHELREARAYDVPWPTAPGPATSRSYWLAAPSC